MKNKKVSRAITLEEFEKIKKTMKLHNMNHGYIGFVKDKIELFVVPCEKATALITLEEVNAAIQDYAMSDVS